MDKKEVSELVMGGWCVGNLRCLLSSDREFCDSYSFENFHMVCEKCFFLGFGGKSLG